MQKKKTKISSLPLMAKRIINDIDRLLEKKIIDIDEIRKAHRIAEELEAHIFSDTELKQLDPLHAVYVYAHNRMDILVKQLMELPACGKMVSALRDAYKRYTPAFPPISPVTDSYFSCWATLDLEVGPGKESLAKIVIALSHKLSTDQDLVTLYKIMQKSRMGLYFHEGVEGDLIILRELVTEVQIKCVCPSGYIGTPGEIWFVRILPEPFPELGLGYSVVFATPYVIGITEGGFFKNTGSYARWQAFLARTLEKTEKVVGYEKLMKYGLNRYYWNEFIFQGYANYTDNVVYLTGIPDQPHTLPHCEDNGWL